MRSLQVDHVHDVFASFQVVGYVAGLYLPLFETMRNGECDHVRLGIILTPH